MTAANASGRAIDELMERASSALVTTHYFDAEKLAWRALTRAFSAADYERMSRICLPLQEARRQKRHEAVDAGSTFILSAMPRSTQGLGAGCYLLEPPLLGIDARAVRDLLDKKRIPSLVLVREPTTQAGKWPIVGVSDSDREALVIRVQVPPPEGFVDRKENGAALRPGPPPSWFLATQEALGDAAIAKVRSELAADHRAQDFFEYLRAVPDHEKLHQALEAACRAASKSEPSPRPRRRALVDDPFSF